MLLYHLSYRKIKGRQRHDLCRSKIKLDKISSGDGPQHRLEKKYRKLKCWGMLASVDLYGCDPGSIRSPKKIREFIIKLCAAIKMKRHGPSLIKKFGQKDLLGYSAMQFIETSSVTVHFDEIKDRAFVEIFSCKFFDPHEALAFCREFLKAKRVKLRYFFRR